MTVGNARGRVSLVNTDSTEGAAAHDWARVLNPLVGRRAFVRDDRDRRMIGHVLDVRGSVVSVQGDRPPHRVHHFRLARLVHVEELEPHDAPGNATS